MTRALGLILLVSACSTELSDPPAPPPATVRERLEEPTRLLVTAPESGGSITAERKVGTGWSAGMVDLGIENGELIVSSTSGNTLTVDGFQLLFKPLDIPEGVFGDTHAQLTHVRLDLMTEETTPAEWTSSNEVHLTAMLDITLSWTLSLGGSPAPLGSPRLPKVPVEIVLTGDGDRISAEVRANAEGELWTWAGLIKLSELSLVLGAEFQAR